MLVVFARIYSKTMLVAYRDIKVNHQNVVDDISKDKAKEKLDPSYRNLDVNFTLYYIINVLISLAIQCSICFLCIAHTII